MGDDRAASVGSRGGARTYVGAMILCRAPGLAPVGEYRIVLDHPGGVVALHSIDHRPMLLADDARVLAPPTRAQFESLLHQGLVDVVAPGLDRPRPTELERLEAQIDMLDRDRVSNGTKAIWVWMRANWDDDMIARYGPHHDPATLKRLRTSIARARGQRRPAARDAL